jgi:hypothetical protein
MIVKIETEIFGVFSIENDMMIKHHPFEINVRYDQETSQYLISISKREINYSSYLPKVEIIDKKITRIEYPSQEFLDEQIQILKHIETFGAIDMNIERINWQNCSIEWIPETPDEEKILQIRKYQRNLDYDLKRKILSQDWLFQTVVHKRQLEHLTLPFAFFREGVNFFHKFQYQNSFINFYLMLEGFFSDGKHYRNEQIKRDFKNAEILNYSINKALESIEQLNGKHYDWLINICKTYNKKVNIDGVIHLLVEQRGSLSHFSLASSKEQKNLFTDKDYESLAYFTMTICIYAIIRLRLEPFHKK